MLFRYTEKTDDDAGSKIITADMATKKKGAALSATHRAFAKGVVPEREVTNVTVGQGVPPSGKSL